VGTDAAVRPADDEDELDESELDEDELVESELDEDGLDDGDEDVLPDVVDDGTVVTTEESSVAVDPLGAAA